MYIIPTKLLGIPYFPNSVYLLSKSHPSTVHHYDNTRGPVIQLRIFERKILREIFGPIQDENGIWRSRKNHELNELIGSADIVRFIKSRRIAWLGHVMRMDGGRMPRRILEWKPMDRRIRGRPRKRWIEEVEEDIQTMEIRGWRKRSKERTEWKKITEKAKTHSGL